MNDSMKMSPPWATYARKVIALFGEDPDIDCEWDEESKTITLKVEGNDKAEAIAKIVPDRKGVGGETVCVNVIPSNRELSYGDLVARALNGNPHFSFSKKISGVFSNPIYYMVFRKQVAQFFNDNLGDIYGNISMLYQDLAEDVIDAKDGVVFCTDTKD